MVFPCLNLFVMIVFLMSHYNYKAYREYKGLADLARRTGEPEEVVEDMEYMANYFAGLLGMSSVIRVKRRKVIQKNPE